MWKNEQMNALKVASITLISVAVVSRPVNAHQSFTTRPAPMTSDPRLTVPACRSIEIMRIFIVSIDSHPIQIA